MDAQQLIDAQFDRAVEIVQSLPKSGPVQTGYDEKLAMYSLYKQATVGNVKSPRPGLWDMLGRAKWDAWAKRKDLDSHEAKWLYVDELLRVLRKPEYEEKQMAKELVAELESYGVNGPNTVPSGSAIRPEDSDSSSSSESEAGQRKRLSESFQNLQKRQRRQRHDRDNGETGDVDDDDTDDDSESDEDEDQVGEGLQSRNMLLASQNASTLGRPPSSLSTNRYRTPLGSMIMSPPLPPASGHVRQRPQTMFVHPQAVQHLDVSSYGMPRPGSDPTMSAPMSHSFVPPRPQGLLPDIQPLPQYETPSAFAAPPPTHMSATGTSSPHIIPGHMSGAASTSGASTFNLVSVPGTGSNGMGSGIIQHPYPPNMHPGHPSYRAADPGSRSSHTQSHVELGPYLAGMPLGAMGNTRSLLERAVESVQSHVAALQERMEALETRTLILARSGPSTPYQSIGPGGSPVGSPFTSRMLLSGEGGTNRKPWWDFDEEYFDWEHMGLWSVTLAPLARLTKYLTRLLAFFFARRAHETGSLPNLSPGMVVLRRLLLDASFLLCVLFFARKIWLRSGVRRREVLAALHGVWGAIAGRSVVKAGRRLVDRGV